MSKKKVTHPGQLSKRKLKKEDLEHTTPTYCVKSTLDGNPKKYGEAKKGRRKNR